LDEKFGVLVAGSRQQRKSRFNEVQIDGWLLNTNVPESQVNNPANNLFVPRNYDQRVTFDQRTRTNGSLVLQYKPNEDFSLTADAIYSDFDIQGSATSIGHWFTSSNIENLVADSNGTAVSFEQNIGEATDFHARTFNRPSEFLATGVNADWYVGPATKLSLDYSKSTAELKDRNGRGNSLNLIGYLNRSRFDHTTGNTLPTITGFESAISGGVSDYLDPANGRVHVALRRGWQIKDSVEQLKFDGIWSAESLGFNQLRFGLLSSTQSKNNQRRDNEANAVHCTFCRYPAEPDIPDSLLTVFDAGNDFLQGVSGSQNIPHRWLRFDAEELFALQELYSGISFDAVARGNSFEVEEQINAFYANFEFEQEIKQLPVSVNLGIRYESTDVRVSGTESQLVELIILDETELGQINSAPAPIHINSSYQHWLPNLDLKFELQQDLIARLSLSKTMTRPTLTQMSPSVFINTTRQGGDLRASRGDPSLRPFEATNLDTSLEWYYDSSSYLAMGYFRKSVDNFITTATTTEALGNDVTDPSTGADPNAADAFDELAIFDVNVPTNGENAKVEGIELFIQHDFSDTGFGVVANLTLVDSNAELDREDVNQVFALTGLSNTKNLVAYYQKDDWQFRLAWNYRDGFLQSLIQVQGSEPTFVDDYQQVDFSASYDINDELAVFFEGVNLTEEITSKHGRHSNQLLLVQETGARFAIGIKGSF
jgi:TonB-dependent receptor